MARWSRQDYEMVAGVIAAGNKHTAALRDEGHIDTSGKVDRDLALAGVAAHFLRIFAEDNDRFSKEAFVKACKPAI